MIKLDSFENWQKWLDINNQNDNDKFTSGYYQVFIGSNNNVYPSISKNLNSKYYFDKVIRNDPDYKGNKNNLYAVYYLKYRKNNSTIDVELCDRDNNVIKLKVAKVIARNNKLTIKYNTKHISILAHNYNCKNLRKKILNFIDNLESLLTDYKVDNTKVDDTFLSDRDRKKQKYCKSRRKVKAHFSR